MRHAVNAAAVALLVTGLVPADLVKAEGAASDALGLPAVTVQPPELVALGRRLFMDRRLSANGTMSCGMCHVPEQAFSHNGTATAVGLNGKSLRRNAPSLLNVAFQERLFHDGRESILEKQVLAPLLAADEMGNQTVQEVLDRVAALADYAQSFERAFAGPPSVDTLARAIAGYERTLISGGSRFDRWRYAGEPALDAREQRGFSLFTGKARCSSCHTVGQYSALFTDGLFHNTGLPETPPKRHHVQLAPGVEIEVADADLRSVSEPWREDLGRFEVTGNEGDRRAFKTPSLRNVALSAPYMHDGSLMSLEQVVEFYDQGGGNAAGKDPLLHPLGLSLKDKQAIAAFLRTLTGDNVTELARAAREAAAEGGEGPIKAVR